MNHDMDTELTPEELEAFGRLPHEAATSDLLEERVVRNLRSRHLLAPRRSPWYRGGQLAAGLAAALILFLGGTVFGQWMAGQTSAEALSAARELRRVDTQVAAAQVQQTGSAYVAALASLHEQSGTGAQARAGKDDDALTQGWEAALSALRAATEELARMDPHDPQVAAALEALEETPVEGAEPAAPSDDTRQVLWF